MPKFKILIIFLHITLIGCSSNMHSSFINNIELQQQGVFNSLKMIENPELRDCNRESTENHARNLTNLLAAYSLQESEFENIPSMDFSLLEDNNTDTPSVKLDSQSSVYSSEPNNRQNISCSNSFLPSTTSIDYSHIFSNFDLVYHSSLQNLEASPKTDIETLQNDDKKVIFDIKFRNVDILKDIHVYHDFAKVIARIIYFRHSFRQLIDSFCLETNSKGIFSSTLRKFFTKNPEFDSNLFYDSKSGKIIKSLMLLIHISIDFIQKNDKHLEFRKRYDYCSNLIYKHRKRLKNLEKELNSNKPNKEKYSELEKKCENERKFISILKLQRETVPKHPTVGIIFEYAKYISHLGSKFGQVGTRWISIFFSIVKIINFYDQNLKEIVDDHLDKFRCSFFYKSRDVLMCENPFIGKDSFLFVILDWIFYFFSPEFQESFSEEHNFNSKLLAKITSLIFILFNNPETIRIILCQNEIFEKWTIKLESNYEHQEASSSSSNIFNEIYEKVEKFNGDVHIKEQCFRSQTLKGSKMKFLVELEDIIRHYLSFFYEKGLSVYNDEVRKGDAMEC